MLFGCLFSGINFLQPQADQLITLLAYWVDSNLVSYNNLTFALMQLAQGFIAYYNASCQLYGGFGRDFHTLFFFWYPSIGLTLYAYEENSND